METIREIAPHQLVELEILEQVSNVEIIKTTH
jgi:hypothetical protein